MWSLRGRLVLFVLLAVMFHCLASADSAQQQPASPSRLGTCRVLINHTIIDLSRLHQAIASVRYTVSVEDGYKVAWNPCTSFNLPTDPHSGSADQCFHVAMCMYKRYDETSDSGSYYTLGIHRTAQFIIPSRTDHTSTTPHDVTAGSGLESWNKTDNSSLIIEDGHVTSADDVSHQNKLTSDRTTAVTTAATTTAAAAAADDDNLDVAVDIDDDETSDDDDDDDMNERSASSPVTALLYRGLRSMENHTSVVYVVCHRRRTRPSFVYLSRTNLQHYFELRFCCCCTDGRCAKSDSSSSDDNDDEDDIQLNDTRSFREELETDGTSNDQLLPKVQRSKRFIWLLLVVNGAILVIALMIAGLCCRRASGGGTGTSRPYSYIGLPAGVHGSIISLRRSSGGSLPVASVTLWSAQSSGKSLASVSSALVAGRDYSKMKTSSSCRIPLLDHCVIPTEHIVIAQRLGGGSFSDTYVAHWKGRRVAAKRVMVGVHQSQMNAANCNWIVDNISLLSKQRHQMLANVFGVCIDSRQPYVIVEFIEGESLRRHIRRSAGDHTCSWSQRVNLCSQIADGLAFLHFVKPPILHRDIRSANIMMDNNGLVKIVNFGFMKIIQKLRNDCDRDSCYCRKQMSGVPDTLRWTAPEILARPDADETSSDVYSTACDVYSFAVLLWEMATFSDPFADVSEESQVMKMVLEEARPSLKMLPYDTPTQYVELITACWHPDPHARPHFKQVLQCMKKLATSCNHRRQRTTSLGEHAASAGRLLQPAPRHRTDSVSSTVI